MVEMIEVMKCDGTTEMFQLGEKEKAKRCAVTDLRNYVREQFGEKEERSCDIAWIDEEQCFAVDNKQERILTPCVFVTPIMVREEEL